MLKRCASKFLIIKHSFRLYSCVYYQETLTKLFCNSCLIQFIKNVKEIDILEALVKEIPYTSIQ